MARVRARAVHLHGINTLYHAVSVYTGMHKTLETLETLALRARVSKPVSAVLYIPVYTSTAWYNLYSPCHLHVVDEAHQFVQKFEGQNGILHAVDGQTTPSLGTALLVEWGGERERERERERGGGGGACLHDHEMLEYEQHICDRICENRPPCKICTVEIRAFERGHVVPDPNFFIMPL